MSDISIVPDLTKENAEKLLSAAEELGLDPSVVRTSEDGFVVPSEVADKAFPPKKGRASAKADEKGEGE
jgi:hypothetical protein